MNCDSGIGPAMVIARASRSGRSGSDMARLGHALRTRDRLDAPAASPGGGDEIDAERDHRQAQPLPHVESRLIDEPDELSVGLAEELDEEAAQAIAQQEDADELARLVTRLGPPEEEPEHREQQQPLE